MFSPEPTILRRLLTVIGGIALVIAGTHLGIVAVRSLVVIDSYAELMADMSSSNGIPFDQLEWTTRWRANGIAMLFSALGLCASGVGLAAKRKLGPLCAALAFAVAAGTTLYARQLRLGGAQYAFEPGPGQIAGLAVLAATCLLWSLLARRSINDGSTDMAVVGAHQAPDNSRSAVQ